VLIAVWRDPGFGGDGADRLARTAPPSFPEGLLRIVDPVQRYQAVSEELSSVARGAQ